MYHIIGGDGKTYGPIDEATLRQWLAEGRLIRQTRVRREGAADWETLGSLPEFAEALSAQPMSSLPPPPIGAFTLPPDPTASSIPEGDYELSIGGCLGRGMDLLQQNFATLFVATLIYLLIELFVAGLGMIPFIGPLFSLANLVIVGPLIGGVCYVTLCVLRGKTTSAGDVFAGFRINFGHLFLGNLVPGLLAGLCVIPAAIAFAVALIPAAMENREPSVPVIIIAGCVFLLCLLPMFYLQICWSFTLPLIVDKGLDFWTAMGVSRRRVSLHFWKVLGLGILAGLIMMAGMALCGVGLLFAAPWLAAAWMYAYETMFCDAPAPRA